MQAKRNTYCFKSPLLGWLAVCLFLSLLTTGCHFQLRGPMVLAKPLQNMYVQSRDPYGDLTRNLKQYLKMSGVHLAATSAEASTILHISQETTHQDLLSINSSQQTRQYTLRFIVVFNVQDKNGNILIPSQVVVETRPLTLQSNQVLAGSNQAAQLYHEMRRAIVYNIMTRLAAQEVTETLKNSSTEKTS